MLPKCPGNADMSISNFSLMFCDAKTMAIGKEEGSKGDCSFHEHKGHICLLTTFTSVRPYAGITVEVQ